MQAHPAPQQLLTEAVSAYAAEGRQRAVASRLAFEACGPRKQVPVGFEVAQGQARRAEQMASVKAEQLCTCHPSLPNLEVPHARRAVVELHFQALQRDLQVRDKGSKLLKPFPLYESNSSLEQSKQHLTNQL